MAQLFQVFRGNTQEELTKVKANTREGMLLKALGSNKGRLEDSNGAVVTEDSKDPVLGDYRFFADAAGGNGELLEQLGQLKFEVNDLKITINRAASTFQREAEIGK
eukprot:jgi/Astpho2/7141/fgenesh1_pg.00111_%23_10_t